MMNENYSKKSILKILVFLSFYFRDSLMASRVINFILMLSIAHKYLHKSHSRLCFPSLYDRRLHKVIEWMWMSYNTLISISLYISLSHLVNYHLFIEQRSNKVWKWKKLHSNQFSENYCWTIISLRRLFEELKNFLAKWEKSRDYVGELKNFSRILLEQERTAAEKMEKGSEKFVCSQRCCGWHFVEGVLRLQ